MSIRLLCALGAFITVLCVMTAWGSGGADASSPPRDPSVTVSTSNANNTTTVTVTVSGLDANTKWKDIHFKPISGKKFPRRTGGTNVSVSGGGNSQTWTSGVTGAGINVYTGGGGNPPAGFGNGTYTFDIPWNATDYGAGGFYATGWTATKDGNASDSDGKIDDSSGEPAANVPQLTMLVNGGNPLPLPINTTTDVRIETERAFSGYTYQLYTSTRLNEAFSDPLGIGIETESSPVPGSWGLTFSNFTGTINASGVATTTPTIAVPNNSGLVGNVLYVVFTLKEEGSIIHASLPVTCTIQ